MTVISASFLSSRPSRLLLYIACVTAFITLFRMWKVPDAPPGTSIGLPAKALASGIDLRILPLGDSITAGEGGSDGNSYRAEVDRALSLSGSKVNMIGSMASGKNKEHHHDGFSGLRISQILDKVLAAGSLRHHPNIILLHAGTNDLKDQDPVPEPFEDAAHRLGVLIDAILCECPDAILMVSKITGQRQLFAQLRIDKFNAEIEGVVAERAARGSKVQLVNHSKIMAFELADDLHPNDAGYSKMTHNWLASLHQVPQDWFKQPVGNDELGNKVCSQEDSYWSGLMAPPKRR